MAASDDARQAIANAICDEYGIHFRPAGMATHALGAVMPDGRTVGQWLDAVPQLIAIAEWAQDAPHSEGCPARRVRSQHRNFPCTCGRDEVMPHG